MVMLAILKTIPCFGLAAFGAVDATPTISWGMNPSSGQAIIWCWLTESNRRHPAYKAGALPAELNQQSGSGLLRIGFNVSCSTSLPKSPDRIAETTKPKGVSLGLLIYFAAQFALTSRAYHNSSSFWLTLQVKFAAICAECVTHWCV